MAIKAKQARKAVPTARIFENKFPYVPCEVFNCNSQASWKVGSPKGPAENCFNLCNDCMNNILQNLPDELGRKEADQKKTSDRPEWCDKADWLNAAGRVIEDNNEEEPKAEKEVLGIPYYECPECDKVFTSQNALNGHISGAHRRKDRQ